MAAPKLGLPPLPSFVIIGAPGCATRWLRFNLDRHPEIYAPPRFGRPPPWFLFHDERLNGEELIAYRREFSGWTGEPIVGALEPRCMIKQTRPDVESGPLTDPVETARRMFRAIPDCKLVLMVRNPIDRIEVDFRRAVELGKLPPDADLATMLAVFDVRLVNLDIYAGGMYSEPIDAFTKRFGDRLLVQFHDDVVAEPHALYRRVLEHVGASPDFVPPELERVRYHPHDTTPDVQLSPEVRLALYDFAYRTQVTDLEEATGRDLSVWDPAIEARV
jgi:hypothetical protein